MSVQYLLMAYNKPLGLYTSVEQTAYWKKGNAGQDIVSRYAPDKGPPPHTHAGCILKPATEVIQKFSVCSLSFCNWVALRPVLSGLKDMDDLETDFYLRAERIYS